MTDNVRNLFGGDAVKAAEPDLEIIEEIEFLLDLARKGQVSGLALVAQRDDAATMNICVGKWDMALVGEVAKLQFGLLAEIRRQVD